MNSLQGYFYGHDNTKLFYKSEGSGHPIIACNGIGVSTFFWKEFQEHFSKTYQFIEWDYRGHGQSETPVQQSAVSIEDLAFDLDCLVTHLNLDKAVIIGHSMGVQVILEYYKNHPNKVSALVPILGSYEKPLDTFMNSQFSRLIFDLVNSKLTSIQKEKAESIFRYILRSPFTIPFAKISKIIDSLYCPENRMLEYMLHLSTLDLFLFSTMSVYMADHSAKNILKNIKAPTMIVAGEYDLFTPVYLSVEMNTLIPNSELLLIKNGSHVAFIEQPFLVLNSLQAFFDRYLQLSTL